MRTREEYIEMLKSDEERGITPKRREMFNRHNAEYRNLFYEPWKEYTKPFRVAGNVYYIGNKLVSVHLIDTGDGLILYDSCFQHTAPMLMTAILDLGFDPRQIKYVVLTHEHFDHYGSAAFFQGMFGAKICVGELSLGREDRPALGTIPRDDYSLDQYTPDILLKTGDRITLGNSTLEVVEMPGHAAGAIACFMNTEEDGKPIRVCFYCGGASGNLARELHKGTELGREMLKRRLICNEILKKEHADVFTCGHPYQMTYHAFEYLAEREKTGKNVFIDPKYYEEGVKADLEAFEKIYDEAKAAGNI